MNRGSGLVGLLIALVIAGIACVVGYRYLTSTTAAVSTIQQGQPLGAARLTADRATLAAISSTIQTYRSEHGGELPADKAAVLALLPSPPRFHCAGNDFEYEAAGGALRLLITDAAACR